MKQPIPSPHLPPKIWGFNSKQVLHSPPSFIVCDVSPQAGLDYISRGHMLADVVAIIGEAFE